MRWVRERLLLDVSTSVLAAGLSLAPITAML